MGSGQMMPELGSRISLISKADIRYEGRLFTVDPQECTIALANVRSFGTEEREAAYPILPQPTVYDYILFRGSDIKDIRVVNNVSIPNDPAIMQMHLPPQQQPGFPQQMPPIQQQGVPMNQFGPFGANMQGPPPSASAIGQSISQPSQLQLLSPQSQQQQQQQSSSQQDSRSGTPNQSRKSPTTEMGVQTNENQRGEGGNKDKMQRNNNNNNNNNNQRYQQRERRDSGRNEQENRGDMNRGGYRQNQNQRMQPQQPQKSRGMSGPQQMGPGGAQNQNQNQNRGYQGGSGRMRPPQNNYGGNQSYHQGQNYHSQNYRGQNNYQSQNYQNQGNRQMMNNNKPNGGVSGSGGPQKNQKTLKFENEFDFEKANSKFEELRSELSKLKVGSEENKNPNPPEQVNGEVEKKDDSGNETGADHEQEGDDGNGYDKTKSFFDNISCEANERSKGKTQRTDWRQERKLNSETFGLTMNRRGNFRGRGYYRNQYGRPMNNYRSGGVMPQYNNNRSRNPQQNGRNFSQGGQQSQSKPAPAAVAATDK